MKRFQFKSIKIQLLVYICMIAITPLIFISIYNYGYFKTSSTKTNLSILSLQSRETASKIEDKVIDIKKEFLQWEQLAGFMVTPIIEMNSYQNNILPIESFLSNILKQSELINIFFVLDKKGTIISTMEKNSNNEILKIESLTNEQFPDSTIRSVTDQTVNAWKFYSIKELNINSFFIASPLKNSMGQIIGYLIGFIDSNKINSVLKSELTLQSKSTISANTYLIVDQQKSLILDEYSLNNNIAMDFTKLPWEILNKKTNVLTIDNQKFYFTSISLLIGSNNYNLVNLIPESIFLSASRTMLTTTAIIFLLTIIITGITVYIIAKNISTPVSKVGYLLKDLANGIINSDQIKTIQNDYNNRQDEMADMINNFVHLTESTTEITALCEGISIGDYSKSIDLRSNQDMLGQAIQNMNNNLKEVVSQANNISKGNYNIQINPKSEKDELALALQTMMNGLNKTDWLNKGEQNLNDKMRGINDITKLSKVMIQYLAQFLEGAIGAFYLFNEDTKTFQLTGSYAYSNRKSLSNEFEIGESIVGQAALEKTHIIINNIPDDYLYIQSGLGESKGNQILVAPLISQNTVRAVIEIGTLGTFKEKHIEFLNKVSEAIAIVIETVSSRTRVNNLLQQTTQQAEELKSQQEELQVTNEELEDQTKVLLKKEKELETSNKELQNQAEKLQKNQQELIQINEEVVRKNKEIEESYKYKSEFLANMSHELKTPLNSVIILSKNLSQNKKNNLTENQIKYAKTIHSSGNDLLELVTSILDFSKLEAGQMQFSFKSIALIELKEYLNNSFSHMLEKKPVEIITTLDPSLPSHITSDAMRLKQVFKNFMSNAIKFTQEGSITISITRPSSDTQLPENLNKESTIAFHFKDTGTGIEKEKQDVVFKAFQQADGAVDRKYGGTGLGLSISNDIATKLEGHIGLESEINKGSTFSLYIPEKPTNIDQNIDTPITDKNEIIPIESTPTSFTESISKVIEDDRQHCVDNNLDYISICENKETAHSILTLCNKHSLNCIIVNNSSDLTPLYLKFSAIKGLILDSTIVNLNINATINMVQTLTKNETPPIFTITSDSLKDNTSFEYELSNFLSPQKNIQNEPIKKETDQQENDLSLTLNNTEKGLSLLENKKILIVDDDIKNIFSIMSIFETYKTKIITAKNGEEAVQTLKKHLDINLVLLDIMMPIKDGFETIKEIRAIDTLKQLPIIILTAKSMKSDQQECLNLGANDFLSKPIDTNKLLALVQLWLQK